MTGWSLIPCGPRRCKSQSAILRSIARPHPACQHVHVFDSHCHLDLSVYDADRAAVLARAAQAGIIGILVPAVRPSTFLRTQAMRSAAGAAIPVYIALGVHPQVAEQLSDSERSCAVDPDTIAATALSAGAVAIGECGLDGGTGARELQEQIFRAHIRAARLTRLPLVLHVLRGHQAAPRILREEGAAAVGGVMHSYSGGVELVSVYRDLGFAFSLAGPVTFPGARRPLDAARAIPDDLLLAETDGPDQTPHPHRGKRNEPAFMTEVIAALAGARGSNNAEIARLTTHNARRLFRLPGWSATETIPPC